MTDVDTEALPSYDLLVVGGGINGVGIARDAAGRGLSVLLCEQDDLAAHTSSASTKLIHGGLRYLEHYEFRLVRKALQERERLIAAAPHILWPLRFVMPHDAHLRPTWMIRAGLLLYDNLARRRRLPGSRAVDLRSHRAGVALKPAFRRGFEYSDGWVDDARLVVLCAVDARERGAEIRTRTRCQSVARDGDHWRATLGSPEGEQQVLARALVNATGPWADRFVRERTPLAGRHKVRLVKGSHLVVRRIFDHDCAYLFQAPDRRVVFALPYERDYTLIGTTDVEHSGEPGAVAITAAEVDYLCSQVNRYFKSPISPADVVWSYAGLRPLLEDQADDPSSVTRDYVLDLDEQGPPALTVYGGKLTTFRVLAEEAMDRLAPKLGATRGAWTAGVPLPGGDLPGGDFERFLAQASARWPWLPVPMRTRMARAYGTAMAQLLGNARGLADLGEAVLPGLHAAEIDYLVREEWALSAADILWRRSKLGLQQGPAATDILDRWLAARAERPRPARRAAARRIGMKRHVLALDQGTTSSRAILFDQTGGIVALAQREFTQYFPQPGWVEHDAHEIWVSQAATITEVLAQAKVTPADLAAVGITNQRETVVLWDRATGQPLAPAIVWQDRRTAERCDELRAAGHEARVSARTGLLLDPYFSGTKLGWLLEHLPGARARAERGELCFGTIDSWLAFKLTGGAHVTDVTNASRTLLLDLASGQWDPEMLALFQIPDACLPRVLPSSFDEGLLARIDGHEVPLTGIAGDQQAALFGQTCFAPGMAKNTYGTGCFMLMNTGTAPLRSENRLLSTVAWDLKGRHYALEGSVFVGGAVVQWLRDGLGLIARSADVGPLAASVPDNGDVYLVPAFTGLGSPHWDPYARGTLVGLTRGSNRGHIARAALESIAFQSAELLGAMQADAGHPLIELRVDGGATANDLLMQFQADLLGVPVVRPKVTETTALGAAYLAGLATGFWSSQQQLSAIWQVDRRFEPAISRDEAAERMRRWSRAVERAKGWSEG